MVLSSGRSGQQDDSHRTSAETGGGGRLQGQLWESGEQLRLTAAWAADAESPLLLTFLLSSLIHFGHVLIIP